MKQLAGRSDGVSATANSRAGCRARPRARARPSRQTRGGESRRARVSRSHGAGRHPAQRLAAAVMAGPGLVRAAYDGIDDAQRRLGADALVGQAGAGMGVRCARPHVPALASTVVPSATTRPPRTCAWRIADMVAAGTWQGSSSGRRASRLHRCSTRARPRRQRRKPDTARRLERRREATSRARSRQRAAQRRPAAPPTRVETSDRASGSGMRAYWTGRRWRATPDQISSASPSKRKVTSP